MARLPDKIDKTRHGFPNMETTPDSEKQKPKYSAEVLNAMISKYSWNKTEIGVLDADHFDELYKYARGQQDIDQYNPTNGEGVGVTTDTTSTIDNFVDRGHVSQKKGWYNINLVDIVSPLPNIMSQIKGKLTDADFDIMANVVDKDSGAEEEAMMHREWVNMKFGKAFDELKKFAGIPVQQKEFFAQDFSELEQMKLDGGFKSPYISQVEKLMKHTEEISMWSKKLMTKYVDDLCVTGYAFGYPEYDHETHKVEWKYANPRDVIIQYSEESEFDDSDYGGVFTYPTISYIRSMSPFIRKKDGSKLTEEDLENLAKLSRGYNGNPSPSDQEWNRNYRGQDYYSYKYDDFKVCVFKGWWIDVEKERKIEYTKKNGSKRFYPYDDSVKKLGKREREKVVRERVLYHGKLILGTDWVMNYGKMPNQPVMASNKPILPLKGVKLKEISIIKRIKPIADQYMISWTRLQNYLANAAMEGYAIDISKLANITDGRGKKYDMLDLVKLYKRSGWFFYKSNMNGYQTGGSPVPISNLPSNLGQMMVNEIGIMESLMRQIETLTGISPVAMGATPSGEQAVGTTQMSLNAFLDSLKVIIDGYRDLKQGLAQVSSKMISMIIKVDPKASDSYSSVIGEEGVQYFKTSTKFNTELGISLKPRPTREQWDNLIRIAEQSFSAKKSANIAGLTEAQYYEIYYARDSGQGLTEIFYKMKYWIKKDQERLDRERRENIQMQTQSQQQVVQTQQAEERKTLQAKMQSQMAEYEAEMRSKNAQRRVDSYFTIEEMRAEYEEKRRLERMAVESS